jgi:hypothetical protein
MNATASSQTGHSGLAPAPELCPSGVPAAATGSPVPRPWPDFLVYSLTSNILGAYQRRGIKRPISQEFARFSAILQKKSHVTCMQNNRQPLLRASLLNSSLS